MGLRWFMRIMFFITVVCIILVITLFIKVYNQGQEATPEKSDVILLLGCKVREEGVPSLLLEYRLERALELYSQGYADKIIVSGGQGDNEPMSEAQAMRIWLEAEGVPKERILTEDQSTSTYENIKYSKPIMEQEGFQTAIIVSNDFHLYRALLMAKEFGITASAASAPTLDYLKSYYYSRELLSVIKYMVIGS